MKIVIIILLVFTITSCDNKLADVAMPDLGENSLLSEATALDANSKKYLEGVYNFLDGTNEFGTEAVVKSNGEYLSIFTGKNTAYFVLKSGFLDSVIILEGYWRYAQGSETGIASLHIKRDEGGRLLLAGRRPDKLIIRGLFGTESDRPTKAIVLSYVRPISPDLPELMIIGHRGGGRNVDRLGASENSIAIIKKLIFFFILNTFF